MRKRLFFLCVMGLCLLLIPAAVAQDDVGGEATAEPDTGQPAGTGANTCPLLVEQAIAATDSACAGTGRNQVCYGNLSVEAVPIAGAGSFTFSQAGDSANVADVQSLRTSAMDVVSGVWGVSVMNVQANITGSQPEYVTYVLFGAVSMDDTTDPASRVVEQTMVINGVTDVYQAASLTSTRVSTLQAGNAVTATARYADSAGLEWVLIRYGELRRDRGWVVRAALAGDDMSALPETTMTGIVYGPMQAFTLSTGHDDAPCLEAPESGLLIQSPEGLGTITLRVNEVLIDIGSTVYLQTETTVVNTVLTINVLAGEAAVTAFDVTQRVLPGRLTRVPLGGDGRATGAPTLPERYDPGTINRLPIALLPEQIVVGGSLDTCVWPQILSPATGVDFQRAGIGVTTVSFTEVPGALNYLFYIRGNGFDFEDGILVEGTSFTYNFGTLPPNQSYRAWVVPNGINGPACPVDQTSPNLAIYSTFVPPTATPVPPTPTPVPLIALIPGTYCLTDVQSEAVGVVRISSGGGDVMFGDFVIFVSEFGDGEAEQTAPKRARFAPVAQQGNETFTLAFSRATGNTWVSQSARGTTTLTVIDEEAFAISSTTYVNWRRGVLCDEG